MPHLLWDSINGVTLFSCTCRCNRSSFKPRPATKSNQLSPLNLTRSPPLSPDTHVFRIHSPSPRGSQTTARSACWSLDEAGCRITSPSCSSLCHWPPSRDNRGDINPPPHHCTYRQLVYDRSNANAAFCHQARGYSRNRHTPRGRDFIRARHGLYPVLLPPAPANSKNATTPSFTVSGSSLSGSASTKIRKSSSASGCSLMVLQ